MQVHLNPNIFQKKEKNTNKFATKEGFILFKKTLKSVYFSWDESLDFGPRFQHVFYILFLIQSISNNYKTFLTLTLPPTDKYVH